MRIALHTGRRHSTDDERLKRTYEALLNGIGNVNLFCNPPLTWKMDIVHAHDLDALPKTLLHKAMTSRHTKVVYDSHEDWSVYTSSTKPYARLSRYAEAMMLPFVDAAISPCPAVTSRLAKRVKVTATILNCPELPPPPFEPKYPVFTVAYVGHIGPHRGYPQLIEAARILKQQGVEVQYLLMGAGTIDIPDDLRLQFTTTGQLPHAEMMKRLQRCHLGLVLFEDTPNARIALPHKLFEYMAAGIPVLYPKYCHSIDRIVLTGLDTACGFETNPQNAAKLAEDIWLWQRDPLSTHDFGLNAFAKAKNDYNANVQAAKLTALYGRIM